MADQKKIKVVHLITLLEFGGAQGNTLYTVQNLDPNIFDASLWAGKGAYWDRKVTRQIPAGDDHLLFLGALKRPVNPIFDLIALVQVWNAFRRHKPHILHTHSSKAGIIGRLAGWLAGVPIIIHTFHGFGFNEHQNIFVKWIFIGIERLIARLSTKLIFVSESNWRTAQKYRIGVKSQYQLIRSGVPLKKLQDLKRGINKSSILTNLSIPDDSRVVLTISAFKPQKNLFDFLRLAPKVFSKAREVFFILIGDGSLRIQLEGEARRIGIKDRVRFLGWREDAAQILACADVFVLTSLWEGLPRALVEAMILGIPSVCFDTDGVQDVLPGQCRVANKDLDKMASIILKLLENKNEWNALADVMKTSITQEFDIDYMVKQQENLYLQLLRRNPSSTTNKSPNGSLDNSPRIN